MKRNDNIEQELTRNSIFVIGRVLSVEGRIVKVRVNKNKNHSHVIYAGKTVKNVSVGSYIKIVKGFINIVGKVEGESIEEARFFNREYNKEETRIDRTLQVSLFGHFEEDCFKQGIKEMPLVDNECYVLDRDEFNTLHRFFQEEAKTIQVGGLTEEPSQKILLSVNKLFASHIGIFGNTGSGKSNTLAKLFTELFNVCDTGDFRTRSEFLIIDFNGEYTGKKVITAKKNVYELSTGKESQDAGKYPVAQENINKLEILSVLLEATEKTQTPFLSRALANRFLDTPNRLKENAILNLERICQDIIKRKNKEFNVQLFSELMKDLSSLVETDIVDENPIDNLKQKIEGYLHYHSNVSEYFWADDFDGNKFADKVDIYGVYLKDDINNIDFKTDEFSKLKLKIVFNYYNEIIKGFSNQEHIRPLIGRMFKKFNMLEKLITVVPENSPIPGKENIVVVSLRDVNIEMKKILPLIICKQLYDEKKADPDRDKSLHIIIDEAHNILSNMSLRESETWKDYRLETFEEIIKEGRKFGTFLTISSQRPFDISATIISQLHNYFIHRLINDNDIQAISKTVAYLDKLSFQSIPILSVGSCFVAGLASDIPVKVDIELLEKSKQPKSDTVNLEKAWHIAPKEEETDMWL